MSDVTVKVRSNGPYLITGTIDLVDGANNAYPPSGGDNVALCRCGASSTKPFCDGTHAKIGFTDP